MTAATFNPTVLVTAFLRSQGRFTSVFFRAARNCVKHTAAEPLLAHATGVHITVTLRTDVYMGARADS